MLEGTHATLDDLARAKGVNATYVSRVLRLTLLAPEIVEAILDGRRPTELQLDELLVGFPQEWAGQRWEFGFLHYSPPEETPASLSGPEPETRIPEPSVPRRSGSPCILYVTGASPNFASNRSLLSGRPGRPASDDRGRIAIMDGDRVLLPAELADRLVRRARLFGLRRTRSALGAALVHFYGLKPEVPEAWLYLEEGRA